MIFKKRFTERIEHPHPIHDTILKARYEFAAAKFIPGNRVLDCPCATGYGTQVLRGRSLLADGADYDAAVIRQAIDCYGNGFLQGDMRSLPVASNAYHGVICLEGIEHIAEGIVALSEFYRVIKPGGRLVLSTPNRETYYQAGKNPYHVIEYNPLKMLMMLAAVGFTDVKMFGEVAPDVVNLYKNKAAVLYQEIKAQLGWNKPLAPAWFRYIVEWLTFDKTTQTLTTQDIRFVRDDSTAETMLFVASKP